MSTQSERGGEYVALWCWDDDCPPDICNGPHVSHRCPNGDLVTVRYDDREPCMFCGFVRPTDRLTEGYYVNQFVCATCGFHTRDESSSVRHQAAHADRGSDAPR